jgi:hypothetical protein
LTEEVKFQETLKEYSAEYFKPAGDGEAPTLRTVDDHRGGWVVEMLIPGTEEWKAVGAMHEDNDRVHIEALPGVEVLGPDIPSKRSVDEMLDYLRGHIKVACAEKQYVSPVTMTHLVSDAMGSLNRLACKTGSLPAYAETLAYVWGSLIAEDVKEGMVEQHISEFKRMALECAMQMARKREERAELVKAAVSSLAEIMTKHTAKGEDEGSKPTTH